MKTVLIPAPYWGQPGHLGWARISRFVRWLHDDGICSVVVRAGSRERVDETEFGEVVTVRDPIGFYRDLPGGGAAIPLRAKSRLRRTLAYLLLVPDPLLPWSRRAAGNPLVLDRAREASLVLASSPPESVHVAAEAMAVPCDTPLVVDLRDGWLDEPIVPLLERSRLQRARHGRLERRVLRRASGVLVTSGHWKSLLCERYPYLQERTTVVTNVCPPVDALRLGRGARQPGRPLELLYAGKISSSRLERRVDQLMVPLVAGLRASAERNGKLVFIGNLDRDERSQLTTFTDPLEELGWVLEIRPPVTRPEILHAIGSADGLLLLSSSLASLPAKLFDYLPSRRPILAVAPAGSAVEEAIEGVPQAFRLSGGDHRAVEKVKDFLSSCRERDPDWVVPERFEEKQVREVFSSAVSQRLL